MTLKNIYTDCPIYKGSLISLRQTRLEDTEGLLKCYSDEKAVPFFNSDNCNGDNFHYTTLERMRQSIEFWNFSYIHKYFIRWTIISNDTDEKLGTIEMFHRIADDEFNHYGLLRIDLHSYYETEPIISDILQIANDNFYEAFDVKAILTKAFPYATERISALSKQGYSPLGKKFMIYDDYYIIEQK
ncbi:hypothetical protein CSC2_51180 [Clostridium zeae]|uniref:GNAT family N-acetyltransferase n=1 Tax=Clostridium zeae TaxID=2759022 RepID=A0ABQ1EID5_9CLOT|nr:N-acetyltransferase [Clostridium zeae]GFZ34592.1 hypothetical protein CSC2_51180 [Clostridium zeae]